MCEEKIGKKTWWKNLTRALTKYGSGNSADKHEKHSQTSAQHEWPKNETAKSFFSIPMLQMRNGQRTDAISETAVFIKFEWIHIDMKTNLLRNKAAKRESKYK